MDLGGIGQTVSCEESGMVNVIAVAPESGFESAEALERNVLENMGKHRAALG
ncbi:MAG: hypothetical protein AB7V14_09790 [Kiritimatiellia bacterium]